MLWGHERMMVFQMGYVAYSSNKYCEENDSKQTRKVVKMEDTFFPIPYLSLGYLVYSCYLVKLLALALVICRA